MTNMHFDDRHAPRRNKKRTQRVGRTRSRVNIPPSPQWIEATIAEHPESSRLRLLYNANDFDALGQGPAGLSNLARLTHPFLLPPPPGWKQFGFIVLQDEGRVVPDLGRLMNIRWQFALEWSQGRSAWDALLFSLDHIDLQVLALPPAYVIPTFFVASMADRPGDGLTSAMVASWGPVLDETCNALDPLLEALYECWVDGPSRAAFRYRQFIEHMPTDGAHSWSLLDPCRRLFGPEFVEEIRSSEHLEATVMRQLRQVSTHLWSRERFPSPAQDRASCLSTSYLSALLPLALWQSPSPVKLDADLAQLHSLDDVVHLWKLHMVID